MSLGRDATCLRNCTRRMTLVPNLSYLFNCLNTTDCEGQHLHTFILIKPVDGVHRGRKTPINTEMFYHWIPMITQTKTILQSHHYGSNFIRISISILIYCIVYSTYIYTYIHTQIYWFICFVFNIDICYNLLQSIWEVLYDLKVEQVKKKILVIWKRPLTHTDTTTDMLSFKMWREKKCLISLK